MEEKNARESQRARLKNVLTPQIKDPKILKDDEDDEDLKKKKAQEEVERMERNEKAINLIFMSIRDHVLRKLDKCTLAAEVWEIRDQLYMPRLCQTEYTLSSLFFLDARYENNRSECG